MKLKSPQQHEAKSKFEIESDDLGLKRKGSGTRAASRLDGEWARVRACRLGWVVKQTRQAVRKEGGR
jgi:hypothetical protein